MDGINILSLLFIHYLTTTQGAVDERSVLDQLVSLVIHPLLRGATPPG